MALNVAYFKMIMFNFTVSEVLLEIIRGDIHLYMINISPLKHNSAKSTIIVSFLVLQSCSSNIDLLYCTIHNIWTEPKHIFLSNFNKTNLWTMAYIMSTIQLYSYYKLKVHTVCTKLEVFLVYVCLVLMKCCNRC